MVFCNKAKGYTKSDIFKGHNPYFNRWFSAIIKNTEYGIYETKSQSLF